jgi:enterochelin esterase family protein
MNSKNKSPFISLMENKLASSSLDEVNALIRAKLTQQSPIIEDIPGDDNNKLVTFMYETETDDVAYIMCILTKQPMPTPMQRLGKSNFYYYSIPVADNIRTGYSFTINIKLPEEPIDFNDEHQLDELGEEIGKKNHFDPYNTKKMSWKDNTSGQEFHFSILEMPNATPKIWSQKDESTPTGLVIQHSISSKILNDARTYWVYTPANYDPNQSYPMLMFFDGQMHYEQQGTALTVILDNLIAAKKIPPLIAVLVDSASPKLRRKELMCDESFTAFIIEELMPSLVANYSISTHARDRIVAGGSLGGLFALYLALQYPTQFAMALCNSPAFWASKLNCDDILDKLITADKKSKLRVYIDLGVLETVNCGEIGMLAPVQHMNALLRQYQHEVKYHTFAGGHDIFCHEDTIPEALIWLLGK